MFARISAFKAVGRVNSSLCGDRKYKMTNLLKRDECKDRLSDRVRGSSLLLLKCLSHVAVGKQLKALRALTDTHNLTH